VTVPLGGRYSTPDGKHLRSVTLPPHTGEVLTKGS
jgi:hypothetical protein